MKNLAIYLITILFCDFISSNSIPKDTSKEQQRPETIIYGVVPENIQNLQQVILTPPILSEDRTHEVCEYKLEPHSNNDEFNMEKNESKNASITIPFHIQLQDKKMGSAVLVVSEGSKLDYETVNHYHLSLVTVFCDTSITPMRHEMSIRVTDVNEFAPEWKEQGYLVEVNEGKLYDPLVKVAAFDRDGSTEFSTICSYKLVTGDVPFVLDKNGYLKNTEPLDYSSRHNYILEVVAEDCAGLVSEKVFVNILIKEKCKPGWTGLNKEMDYKLLSTGPSLLFPQSDATLEMCNKAENCTVEQVTVSLRLVKVDETINNNNNSEINDATTTEVDKLCDLDTESIKRRFKTCESGLKTVDLLLPETIGSDAPIGNDGLSFNGKTVYNVLTYKSRNDDESDGDNDEKDDKRKDDGEKVNEDDQRKKVESFVMTRNGPNSRFSISTWLKRGYDEAFAGEGRDEKQSIVCSSDVEGMSRSHVSIFLHNCHLVVLARFEPSGRHLSDVLKKGNAPARDENALIGDDEEVSMDTQKVERNEDDEFYRHSEWHWRLEQVCDNKWHHYAINVGQDKARLFIDGNLFIDTRRNPVVIDDHALHLSKKVNTTKLTIGACWKGLTQSYGDYLRGQIAGLRVLRRSLMSEQTIRCINNCNEKLDFHSINEMESGMSVSMNSHMTELAINGKTKASVEHLLSRVGYINPRMKMLPSSSNLSLLSSSPYSLVTLQNSVKCTEETNPRQISSESMRIHLLPSDKQIPDDDDDEGEDGGPSNGHFDNDGENIYSSSLFISGTQRLDFDEKDVPKGIQIFRDVVIYLYPPEKDLSYEELVKENPHMSEIKSCKVTVFPLLNAEVDDLTLSHALKEHLGIVSSPEGLVIKGPGRAGDFVDVLRKVYYVHHNPENLNKKTFSLSCHDRDGQRSKDELLVQLSIIHFDYTDNLLHHPAHIGQNKFAQPLVDGPQKADGVQVGKFVDDSNGSKSGNASVVTTITICICMLMVVISVGMYRVFFHRQKTVKVHVDNQQDPQRDQSTITITVNPLETAALREEEQLVKEPAGPARVHEPSNYYYDDDDDIGSAHEMMGDTDEEDVDEEGEEGGKAQRKREDKYSDEDASKINHFVMSDTE